MAEQGYVTNLNNMGGMRSVLYDAKAVPGEVWRALQLVQRDSIRANLEEEQWDKADRLVRMQDFKTYRKRRVNPNRQRGRDGWNKKQIFRKPLVAVTFDRSNQVVGGVLTANNTSGSDDLPGPLWRAEAWGKMLTPPGRDVPKLGGKRYVHLREAYSHPEAQLPLEVDEGLIVVSGIEVVGAYHSFQERDPRQKATAYRVLGDPADRGMVVLTDALDMQPTGGRPNTIPGFSEGSTLERVQTEIGHLLGQILLMSGAAEAINGVELARVTR